MPKLLVEVEKLSKIKKEKIWTKDFILVCMANFFIFLGFQMTMPTIPLFVAELGGNEQYIGFVVGIFTFSALIIRPYSGRALETKGRRFIYLLGLIIFVFSVGSFSFAASIFFLFSLRFVQGIGWGLSTTASGTIATDLIPASRRAEGLGYFGLSASIALALGPSLGLILVGQIPFQLLFLLCAILGLIAFILSSFVQYKKVDSKQTASHHMKWEIYEKTAIQPSILIFFITVTFGGIATFLPLYTSQKNVDGIQVYFLIYALSLMLTRTFAGQLYDRKGHRAVFLPGAILIFLSMLFLAWMPNNLILFIAAFCYGFGFGIIQPAIQAWAIEQSPKNRRGMANATFFSFFDLGIGIGAILFGQIGYWLGYQSIYFAAALSILFAIAFYLSILHKEKSVHNTRNEDKIKSR